MFSALRTIGFGTALLFSLLVQGHGNAAPINFQFNGSLNDVDDSAFTLGAAGTNAYVTGLTSPGSVTFTPSTRSSKPSENIGRYNPMISSRTRGGTVYTTTFSPTSNFIRVTNSPVGDSKTERVDGLSGNLGKEFSPTGFHLELVNPSAEAFVNDQHSTSPPSLSSFAHNRWRLIFEGTGRRVHGVLTSLVPLPAAVWLFSAGLVALVGLGSRGVKSEKETQMSELHVPSPTLLHESEPADLLASAGITSQ
jgi:hypothetical protein